MSGKDKKRQKSLRSEPAGEQNVPKKAIWIMLSSGILMVALLGFVPDEWWLSQDSSIKQAKVPLLTLVSASMALATVLLTTNYSDNKHKVWAYAITGVVAWAAVMASVSPITPEVVGMTLLAISPLAIAVLRPLTVLVQRQAIPFYLMLGGIFMFIIALVLASTKLIFILVVLFGPDLSEAIILLVGILGLLIFALVILYGSAKLVGSNTNPFQ